MWICNKQYNYRNSSQFGPWHHEKYDGARRCERFVCAKYINEVMIYMLTATELTPGGSGTVHIYKQTTYIYIMIQNRTERIWKNVVNETDLYASNFKWSVYLLIMIDTLFLRPSLHSTTLQPTTLYSTLLHLSTLHFFPFKLHPTTLHYPLFGLTTFKFPTAPFQLTSLPFTALSDDFRPLLFLSLHPAYNCFPNSF